MKRKPILKFYRSSLSPAQIAEGMNAAARNAQRLYEDARLLLDASRYPTACSLAALSLEESGKIGVLRELAVATNKQQMNAAWRRYSDHRSKNAHWIFFDVALSGARTINDFDKLFDSKSDHPALLDCLKQIGLYTDCCGDGHWSEPDEVIERKLARCIVHAAKVMLPSREATSREVELWIEHIGSKLHTKEGYAALFEYEKAMVDEGLSAHTLPEIKQFLGIER